VPGAAGGTTHEWRRDWHFGRVRRGAGCAGVFAQRQRAGVYRRAVQQWLASSGIATLYIPPACPWENPFSESFNGKLRDEFLEREEFTSLAEAQVLGAEHQRQYNHERPHSSLDYQTPVEFAAACRRRKR